MCLVLGDRNIYARFQENIVQQYCRVGVATVRVTDTFGWVNSQYFEKSVLSYRQKVKTIMNGGLRDQRGSWKSAELSSSIVRQYPHHLHLGAEKRNVTTG